MTLVVGIRCNDGIVIGTDSAMTFGPTPEHPTIEQPLRRKIDVIQDSVIVAGTGFLGLGQRFVDIVRKGWNGKIEGLNEKLFDKEGIDVGRVLSQITTNDFKQTGVQVQQVSYGALLAAPCKKKPELIEFRIKDFQPEVKDKDNWYVSMGSGQFVADPLLGFVRKTFWGDDPPNLQDGIFAATMVLKLGCEMTPMGVSAPIQMAVLDKNKKGFNARHITDEERTEHEASVDSAIEYFREYKYQLSGTDAKMPPQP